MGTPNKEPNFPPTYNRDTVTLAIYPPSKYSINDPTEYTKWGRTQHWQAPSGHITTDRLDRSTTGNGQFTIKSNCTTPTRQQSYINDGKLSTITNWISHIKSRLINNNCKWVMQSICRWYWCKTSVAHAQYPTWKPTSNQQNKPRIHTKIQHSICKHGQNRKLLQRSLHKLREMHSWSR